MNSFELKLQLIKINFNLFCEYVMYRFTLDLREKYIETQFKTYNSNDIGPDGEIN